MQIALHWSIAALVAFQIFFHGSIEALWADRMAGTIPNEATPNPHAILGVLIFVLAVWRLILRWRRGAPPIPEGEPAPLRIVARLTHGAFYFLLLVMPLAGAMAWFGGAAAAGQFHAAMAPVLIVLILLHIVGALVHHFWFRTDVMARMWSW